MSKYEMARSKCPLRDKNSMLYISVLDFLFSDVLMYFYLPLHGDTIHTKRYNFCQFTFSLEFNKIFGCPVRNSLIRDKLKKKLKIP